MAAIPEDNTTFPSVTLVEVTDVALGGSTASVPNRQFKELVDRTAFIKNVLDNTVTLVIGTDVQAWSSKLDGLALLTDGSRGLVRKNANNGFTTVARWIDPFVTGGRLSPTTDPYNTSTASSTTLYYMPAVSSEIALYDGTTEWQYRNIPAGGVTLNVSGLTASTTYDIFIFDSSGTLVLEAVAWDTVVSRGASLSLVRQDGVFVRSGATNRKYLGTLYTDSSSNLVFREQNRHLWNYYNRQFRPVRKGTIVSSADFLAGTTTYNGNERWIGNVFSNTDFSFVQGIGDYHTFTLTGYTAGQLNYRIRDSGFAFGGSDFDLFTPVLRGGQITGDIAIAATGEMSLLVGQGYRSYGITEQGNGKYLFLISEVLLWC